MYKTKCQLIIENSGSTLTFHSIQRWDFILCVFSDYRIIDIIATKVQNIVVVVVVV